MSGITACQATFAFRISYCSISYDKPHRCNTGKNIVLLNRLNIRYCSTRIKLNLFKTDQFTLQQNFTAYVIFVTLAVIDGGKVELPNLLYRKTFKNFNWIMSLQKWIQQNGDCIDRIVAQTTSLTKALFEDKRNWNEI